MEVLNFDGGADLLFDRSPDGARFRVPPHMISNLKVLLHSPPCKRRSCPTGTGAHHQTGRGCERHGRVYAASGTHGDYARAVAQMSKREMFRIEGTDASQRRQHLAVHALGIAVARAAVNHTMTDRGETSSRCRFRKAHRASAHSALVPAGEWRARTHASHPEAPSDQTNAAHVRRAATQRRRLLSRTPSRTNALDWKKRTTSAGRSISTASSWPRSTNATTSSRANSRVNDVAGPKCQSGPRLFMRAEIRWVSRLARQLVRQALAAHPRGSTARLVRPPVQCFRGSRRRHLLVSEAGLSRKALSRRRQGRWSPANSGMVREGPPQHRARSVQP